MTISDLVFYILSAAILISAVGVLLLPNPIHSALSLAVTMVSLGFMYLLLDAYFIAGVQLIVYAGAVMVLFVMVLMLFDLKHEAKAFSGGAFGKLIRTIAVFLILGSIAGAISTTAQWLGEKPEALGTPQEQVASVKFLAVQTFTQHVFAFELLGVLLLLIAIGVVAVSRSRGGTHAANE